MTVDEAQRYTPYDATMQQMVRLPDGDFVRYEDYATLRARVEALQVKADRYDWLREQEVRFNLSPKFWTERLDAAIDAALDAARRGGEGGGNDG